MLRSCLFIGLSFAALALVGKFAIKDLPIQDLPISDAGMVLAESFRPPLKAWNLNPNFHLESVDTGNIVGSCAIDAPWGSFDWGIEASSFLDTQTNALDASRFRTDGGDYAYLYGRETEGSWGFARYVQGDIWGGSNCNAPIPWFIPEPLPVAGREITLNVRAFRDITRIQEDGWIMFAINVWLSSEYLPDLGGADSDIKPLVIDLAFYQECNFDGCGLRNFESESAFHYQVFLDTQAPEGEWVDWTIDLSRYIREAVAYEWENQGSLPLDLQTLNLYQLDVLVELRNAEGALSIDRLALRWQDWIRGGSLVPH